MKTWVVAGMAGLLVIAGAHGQMSKVVSRKTTRADAAVAGNLHVPEGYRTAYQLLGGWAVAADEGRGSKELHVVYASPGTITAYRNDGRFPDGAVLVKEVFQTATGEKTTGTVSHAGSLKGWFVMVKDGKRPLRRQTSLG